MPIKIFSLLSCVFLIISFFGCSPSYEESDTQNSPKMTQDTPVNDLPYLQKSTDMGQEYIDSFIFLGESTTTHLKSRGVLSGGKDTNQVWSPKSGTLMLDISTSNCRIVYPDTGEEIDLCVAMSRKKPKYMLLTFGLNGASRTIEKGSDYFKSCYSKLIDTLLAASPETKIIIQSCFPVAKNMDMSSYSIDAKTLNSYIDEINSWAQEFAIERSIGYLNTAEILKDENGFLFSHYQVGDGYHLTKEAYVEILKYIRTHAYTVKEI